MPTDQSASWKRDDGHLMGTVEWLLELIGWPLSHGLILLLGILIGFLLGRL